MHRMLRPRAARPAGPAVNPSSVTDITTSLIGVMLLVLMGILVTTATGTSLVELVEARQDPLRKAASPEPSHPFYPDCLEVSRAGVRFLGSGQPGEWEAAWRAPDSSVMVRLRSLASARDRAYPLLLVRPGGAHHARELRDCIRGMGLNVGVELVSSGTRIVTMDP